MIAKDKSNEELIKELQELKQENNILKALYEKDIIERNLMEAELRQSEARFRCLLQDIENISVQGYGPDGTTQYWNRASEKIYGYSAKEAIGRNLVDLIIPHEMKEFVENAIKEMAVTGQPIPAAELSLMRKDGSLVSVFSSHAIIKIPGQIQELFCIDIDLTKLKQTETELFRAEKSDRLKSAFLANMSHEIRTPMNGIIGFADLLKNHKLTGEQQQEYIRIIEQSGVRMLNIINDIIDISRIEVGLMTMYIKESNINEQIEYIYTFFKPEIEAKGMKFTFKNSLSAEDSIIKTDREKVFAILTNLVKNAIKYSNEGEIEFGYLNKIDYLEFFVKDTGIGIPKDKCEVIFERFIQSDNANEMARHGAGLGLSITKAYVEMLGGNIWVESDEKIGSTFYFTLPFHSASIEKKNIQIDNFIEMEVVETIKLKILIAEDDTLSVLLFSLYLKEYSKQLLIAKTGNEAVDICRENPDLDLILMDIQMPDLNGYEATRQIRQFNKNVIIIVETACGLSGDRQKSIEAGCNDYILKPIIKDELHSLIQKYFDKQ